MTQRISVGAHGEFFIEANEALSAEQLPLIESLYKMILNARVESGIYNEARDILNDGEN